MVLLSIEIYVLVILVLHLYSSEAAISRHCSAFDSPSKQCVSDIEMHWMHSGPVPAYEGRMGQRGRCSNDPPIKKKNFGCSEALVPTPYLNKITYEVQTFLSNKGSG